MLVQMLHIAFAFTAVMLSTVMCAEGPIGYGKDTTGGQGGQSVTVTDPNSLKKEAESAGKKIIIVKGTLTASQGMSIDVRSDKSIIGDGAGATLQGIGFHLNQQKNIIIQNLKMTMTNIKNTKTVAIGSDNCLTANSGILIWIERSQNVWVDHCDLFNEKPGSDKKSVYHVLVGVSRGSQMMTFSWNKFHDMGRTFLIGADDTETTDWKVTIHHNLFQNTCERNVLMRGGTAHFYNNYLNKIDYYGTNAITGGCIKVEKNVYDQVDGPIVANHPSAPKKGAIENIGNVVNGGVFHDRFEKTPAACKVNIPYQYTAEDPNTAKANVLAKAGIGSGNGGGSPGSSASAPSAKSPSAPAPSGKAPSAPAPAAKGYPGAPSGNEQFRLKSRRRRFIRA